MEHILFKQKIKEEAKVEYINEHRNPSYEFLESFKKAGMERVIVWIDNKSDDLYVYMMTKDFNKSMAKLINKKIILETSFVERNSCGPPKKISD
ncbi:MAG: L-rhamnose mutarotase [Candidatus Humimicrobiaceae bacterium]